MIFFVVVGAAIIILLAGLLLQMGLPGSMQVFTSIPSTIALFEFPMVLAPTLVVPLLVGFNLLASSGVIHQRHKNVDVIAIGTNS